MTLSFKILLIIAAVVVFIIAGLGALGSFTGINILALDSFALAALALSFVVP